MAAIELSAKEIYSRVLQAVPGVSENYVLNLLNQGLVEIGQFQSNIENAKIIKDKLTDNPIVQSRFPGWGISSQTHDNVKKAGFKYI